MITRHPIDRRDLHQVLHYCNPMPEQLRLTLDQQPDQDMATVKAEHRPADSALLPVPRAMYMLRRLLAHYPVRVTVNGEILPRSDFNSMPSIALITTDPPILPGPGDHRHEMLTGVQQHDGTLLFDGLLYYVAQPEHLEPQTKRDSTQSSLHVNETIACSNPDWRQPHVMPAQRYHVEHNLVHYADDQERADTSFVEIIGTTYCVPGPTTVAAMEPQLEPPRLQVARHAKETGRTLLGSSWDALTRAWHPGYDDLRLLITEHSIPVKPSPATPRPIRWAIAEALLASDQHGLVPVSDGHHTDVWLDATRLRIQTPSGHHHNLQCDSDLIHELRKIQPDLRSFLPAASITLDCTLHRDGGLVEELSVDLDLLPTGWIDIPLVLFRPDAVHDLDTTAHRLACAYNRWRAEEDHYPDTLQAAQVLAKRMIEGELQGFAAEMQRLANSFRPTADPPTNPVTVTSADGRLTLHWSSTATSRTPDTTLPIS